MSTRTLTQRHRAQQLLLRRATIAQLTRLWPVLDWTRLDETYPVLAVNVAKLVQSNRQTSSGLAAQYLRVFRTQTGVPGDTKLVIAPPLIVDQLQASLHATSVAAVKNAAGRGVLEQVAMADGLTQTQGAMARLVLNAGRRTVIDTLGADDRARGYQRVLGGAGCEFCRMLAGRGVVYGEQSAEFEAHDHCGCTAEPVYA